jgi:hypothetical protein
LLPYRHEVDDSFIDGDSVEESKASNVFGESDGTEGRVWAALKRLV